MGQQLSWLEHTTDNREVGGSSPLWPTNKKENNVGHGIWGYSSAGRAPALQAGGQRFDPAYLHHRRRLIEAVLAERKVSMGFLRKKEAHTAP